MPARPTDTRTRDALARTASLARRARRLPASSWGTLVQVLPVLLVVRMALWVLPYRTVSRLFDVPPDEVAARTKETPRRTVALVRTVAWAGRTLLADRPCLTQAIAGRWLLARRGYVSDLKMGVRRKEGGGGIAAHAWLEMDGRIVLGGGDSPDVYTPFRPARASLRERAADGPVAEPS